jgi:two-component system, sensor histidine kinase and response regulator
MIESEKQHRRRRMVRAYSGSILLTCLIILPIAIIHHVFILEDFKLSMMAAPAAVSIIVGLVLGTIQALRIRLTEQKRQLEVQNARLSELNATKDKLFSIIGHDLKNPLTAILGYADLIITDIDNIAPDRLKSHLTQISNASNQLYGLLENLLEWSRSQTGRMEFSPARCDLQKLVENCTGFVAHNAAMKEIEILSDVEQGSHVFADNRMLDTVLRNLISNAIKFTPNGGEIRIRATRADGEVEVSVADTGVGITEQDANKLFRIDAAFSTAGTAQEQGTGLGLILCKEFIDKHQGKIWVESVLGQGSVFRFTLPPRDNKVSGR